MYQSKIPPTPPRKNGHPIKNNHRVEAYVKNSIFIFSSAVIYLLLTAVILGKLSIIVFCAIVFLGVAFVFFSWLYVRTKIAREQRRTQILVKSSVK